MFFFWFLLFPSSNRRVIVENDKMPLCINCKHFVPYNGRAEDANLGKCSLFQKRDLVRGQIRQQLAFMCRENPLLCNVTGNYYEPVLLQEDKEDTLLSIHRISTTEKNPPL